MTTIVYRDGVIAGDRMVTCDSYWDASVTKIAKRVDLLYGKRHVILAGAAGTLGYVQAFLEWFKGGEQGERPSFLDEKNESSADAFIVRNNLIQYFTAGPNYKEIFTPVHGYYAIGSGKEYAYGAMAFGADVSEAIRCAAKFDRTTSHEHDVLGLE